MNGLSRITAGILSYNRRDDLRRTLRAVLDIKDIQVLVIDNASTDGTVEMLAAEFGVTAITISGIPPGEPTMNPDVDPDRQSSRVSEHRPSGHGGSPLPLSPYPLTPLPPYPPTPLPPSVILLNANRGIAARNLFIDHVTTEFLLSLDDDSWPRAADDVERMLRTMESDARIASVCASCVHPDTGVAETEGIERHASGGSAERGYDVVNIAAGGSLLRMEALRGTRGYGEEFFWGREENDLAFQLLQRGWRVVYDPRAVIWHALSPAGRMRYERLRHVTRNSFWLLWKYFPLAVALPLALLFALRRLLPVVKDPRRFAPVLRGIAAGFGGIAARRRLSPGARRFTLRESMDLRGWFRKLLSE